MVRATVKQSQAKARATRRAARPPRRRSRPTCRWPGCWSTSPLAHLDRTFDYAVPASDGRRRRGRACGSRCASRARTSTGSCSSGSPRATTPGVLAPLRRVVSAEPVLTPRGRGPGRPTSPSGTPASAPTCCGWPCRRGTPPPRSSRRRPSPPWSRARPSALPAPGRPTRTRRPSSTTSPTAALRGRCGRAGPGDDWPALLAEAAATTLRARPRRAAVRARRQGRRPRRRRPDPRCWARATTSSLTADAGPAARYRDFLAVAARHPPHRRRHPGGGLRPGRRPRAGRGAGTTATTCTPSPARPTPTPARCCCCAPSVSGRPRWSAGSRAASRPTTSCAPGWAHELALPRAGGAPARHRARRRRHRRGPPAGSRRPGRPDARARCTTLVRAALAERPGAGADAARRLRPRAGVRALPHAGALRRLPRARSR